MPLSGPGHDAGAGRRAILPQPPGTFAPALAWQHGGDVSPTCLLLTTAVSWQVRVH